MHCSFVRGLSALVMVSVSLGATACSGGAGGMAAKSETSAGPAVESPDTTSTTTGPARAEEEAGQVFGGPDDAVAHLYEAWHTQDRTAAELSADGQAVDELFGLAPATFTGSGCTQDGDASRCHMDGEGRSLRFEVRAEAMRGFQVASVEIVPHEAAPASPPVEEPAVLELQQQLEGLGFWLGDPDGRVGPRTVQALMAFQKANDLTADGKAGPATLDALESGVRPTADSTVDGIEIDLDRQLLLVIAGGEVRWVLNTSTGAPATPTSRGNFVVQRRIDGTRQAPLGPLYRPAYFDEGIAIHGAASIPPYPASHGCARVSNAAMDMLWASNLVELGTPVRVV